MWIEPYGDKYKYIERYKDAKTGKTRRVSTVLNSDSKQAQNKARIVLAKKIEESRHKTDIKDFTFADMYKLYYGYKSQAWSLSTRITEDSCYNNHFKHTKFNNFLLSKITLADVQSVVDEVQHRKNLSRRYAVRASRLISAVYKHAIKFYDIQCPIDFSLIEIKNERTKRKDVEYIDSSILRQEIKKMREAIPEVYVDFIEVQILTGMRFGELSAITKDDWDRDNNTIIINKAVETCNRRSISHTKNYSSNRVIESNDRINEIFDKRIRINDALFKDKSSIIFANQRNRPQMAYYINRLLKQINKDYFTHTMRHTHISLLAEKGLPIKYIMDRVGHSRAETTLKIYNHVTSNMRKKGAETLNNLF